MTTPYQACGPRLKRRSLLKLAFGASVGAVGGGVPTALSPAPARAQSPSTGKRELIMVTSWPKNSAGPGQAAERLASRIAELSEGKLVIKIMAAGSLVPALEVFDAVTGGSADMAHSASFYWQGKIAAASLFTTIPFGMTPLEQEAWLSQGDGQKLWQQSYDPFDLIPLAASNTGPSMAGWFHRPLHSLKDLVGMKIRMAGIGGAIFTAMGAQTMLIPPAEMVMSLSQGVVDGVEFLSPSIDIGFGLDKMASYYYGPGFTKPNGSAELIIARRVWDSFSPTQRSWFSVAARAEYQYSLAEASWQNSQALETLRAKGVEIAPLPTDIIAKAESIAAEQLNQLFAKDAKTLAIWQNYKQALTRLRGQEVYRS